MMIKKLQNIFTAKIGVIAIIGMLICSSTFSSCNKIKKEKFYWNQTACSDPWKHILYTTDIDLKEAVISYLEDENIKVKKVTIEYDESLKQYCYSCGCTSGNVIIVTVKNKDKFKMIDLKFIEYQ